MERNNFLLPVAHFHSLRDTRSGTVTWQAIFKKITDSTHAAACPSDFLSGGYGQLFCNFLLYKDKKYLPLKERTINILFI